MEWLWTVLFAIGVLSALVIALVVFQRSLDKPGGRDGLGTMGDGMGAMGNFFAPGQADAKEELDRQKKAAAVMPKAEDADEKHGAVSYGADGRPKSIRLNVQRDRDV
ncbi:hypothetical protein ASD11_02680 [Aeromicrobium sp. Root495]|uniref:hypothetical protein n=1 Tax=Aeromicrobium sp. Root495 TaxID=1736550 RepID=UPI000700A94E|nr:hypothetical protein [Aeromicrobium sp. Root495]KQY58580.1 hypothetical protein ASD11_02680 [Aeromicrobium sp. Root495]